MMQYRTLKEEELEEWFDHVDHVFEQTPRSYFVNHWNNDPSSSVDNVFVAYDNNSKRIVSTVRLVPRKIQIDQQVLLAGGIAEVSTRPEYRKQGLASKLLQIVFDVMRARDMYMGVLSASKASPFYRQLGWITVPNFWTVQTVPEPHSTISLPQGTKIRKPNYESKTELHLLVKHHREYNEDFNGLIYRDSEEYWAKWVQFQTDDAPSFVLVSEKDDAEVLAFATILCKDGVATVKDFATDKSLQAKDKGKEALKAIVGHAVSQFPGSIQVKYPSVLFDKLYDTVDSTTEKNESYMYKCIDDLAKNSGEVRRTISVVAEEICGGPIEKATAASCKHLFWDVDKF